MSERPAGGRRLRRTWPQRLLIAFNTICILTALAGAGLVAYGKRTVAQINRVDIDDDVIRRATELADGEPQNFLVVGVDSDEGLAADDPVRDGRDAGPEAVGGYRSDTMMLVRLDPEDTKARILSFPRDLWVDIPGQGRNRINSALSFGEESGPGLLIRTIQANFGIDVNHYVQVDFAGFKNLVKQIGGVPVYFDTAVRDPRAGLDVPEPGCVVLDEHQALAYARSRHLQYRTPDGGWRTDGTSDLGRISRQQDFAQRVLSRAIDKGARNPGTLARMVDNGSKHITLDEFTTPADLLALGSAFRDYDPDTLLRYSLPVADAVRGGAAVLDLVETEAEPILELFRGTGSSGVAPDVEPAEVAVRVVNGSGRANQAGDSTDRLAAAGFQVLSPGDLPAGVGRTEVRYPAGAESKAVLVARYLAADPLLVASAEVSDVTVVTGPDFFAVRDEPVPESEAPPVAGTTTTTTAPEVADPADGGATPTAPTTTAPVDPGVPVTEPAGYVPQAPPDADCG